MKEKEKRKKRKEKESASERGWCEWEIDSLWFV
jgi:hypothetical protein